MKSSEGQELPNRGAVYVEGNAVSDDIPDIPEVEESTGQTGSFQKKPLAEKEFFHGIDISVLTRNCLHPADDIDEPNVFWDWNVVFTEMSLKYARKSHTAAMEE